MNRSATVALLVAILMVWAAPTHAQDPHPDVSRWTAVIERHPGLVMAYVERGKAYLDLDDTDAARADFEKAIVLAPDNASAYFWRGRLYSRQGDFARAAQDYRRAVALDPDEQQHWRWLGYALYDSNELNAALEVFEDAAQAWPDEPLLVLWQGYIHYELRDFPSTVDAMSRAVDIGTDNPRAWEYRALAYTWLEQYGLSLNDYTTAIARDPADDPALSARLYSGRGVAHAWLDDWPAALQDFNRAVKLAPDEPESSIHLMRRADALTLVMPGASCARATADFEGALALGGPLADEYISRISERLTEQCAQA